MPLLREGADGLTLTLGGFPPSGHMARAGSLLRIVCDPARWIWMLALARSAARIEIRTWTFAAGATESLCSNAEDDFRTPVRRIESSAGVTCICFTEQRAGKDEAAEGVGPGEANPSAAF